ncbi:MAG: PstS family phosphate ABC transporter substrate-binding protein [Pseudomonadales bacterium]
MKPILMLTVLCLILGCSNDRDTAATADDSQLSGAVRMDGSSTVFPISEAVAEEYLAVQPRVRVTVGVSGTGGGFKKFLNQEIDINAASRPIKASENQRANATGIEYIEIPVAFDGLSVVVNPENDWVDFLTVAELNLIWKPDSPVTTWADVRSGWPDQRIRLYGPGTDSGTFDYFTGTINGKEQASRPDFTASEDDNVLVQGISGDTYALGYFGYAYYSENAEKLKIVPIDGGKGPIAPTEKTINDGSYSPLSRPIYIYANAAALDQPQISGFISFYLNNAAILAQEVGYIALPEAAYEAARQRVANRNSGSSYHGDAPLPHLTDKN